jgi:hypothetical protein
MRGAAAAGAVEFCRPRDPGKLADMQLEAVFQFDGIVNMVSGNRANQPHDLGNNLIFEQRRFALHEEASTRLRPIGITTSAWVGEVVNLMLRLRCSCLQRVFAGSGHC